MSFVFNHNFQRVKYFYITAHSFYLDLGKSQTSQCKTASHAESFLQWNPPVQRGWYCLVLRGLHGNPWFSLGMSKPLLGAAGSQARGLWDHSSPANSTFHLLPPFSHTLTHMPSTELNLIVKLSGFQDQMLSKEEQTGSSEGWDVRGPRDFTFKATVKSS